MTTVSLKEEANVKLKWTSTRHRAVKQNRSEKTAFKCESKGWEGGRLANLGDLFISRSTRCGENLQAGNSVETSRKWKNVPYILFTQQINACIMLHESLVLSAFPSPLLPPPRRFNRKNCLNELIKVGHFAWDYIFGWPSATVEIALQNTLPSWFQRWVKDTRIETTEEDIFSTPKNLANPFTSCFEIACPLCKEKWIKYLMRNFLFRPEFSQRQRKITAGFSHGISNQMSTKGTKCVQHAISICNGISTIIKCLAEENVHHKIWFI